MLATVAAVVCVWQDSGKVLVPCQTPSRFAVFERKSNTVRIYVNTGTHSALEHECAIDAGITPILVRDSGAILCRRGSWNGLEYLDRLNSGILAPTDNAPASTNSWYNQGIFYSLTSHGQLAVSMSPPPNSLYFDGVASGGAAVLNKKNDEVRTFENVKGYWFSHAMRMSSPATMSPGILHYSDGAKVASSPVADCCLTDDDEVVMLSAVSRDAKMGTKCNVIIVNIEGRAKSIAELVIPYFASDERGPFGVRGYLEMDADGKTCYVLTVHGVIPLKVPQIPAHTHMVPAEIGRRSTQFSFVCLRPALRPSRPASTAQEVEADNRYSLTNRFMPN